MPRLFQIPGLERTAVGFYNPLSINYRTALVALEYQTASVSSVEEVILINGFSSAVLVTDDPVRTH